ncbi:MAG TPA: YnfA family protein [Roseiflexaceae bacterium]|nr:YnfA family protein [Roseiflexaceae bacterium]HMP40975.1 YnfA family protein [Roseiflexaceae bacterium]
MELLRSLAFFLAAGLYEIGGGYRVWVWLSEGRSPWYAVVGAVLLVLYGVIPAFQAAHFSRVYAAYGGVFVLLSILWGWRVDGTALDRFDMIGALFVLLGVAVMMYWPRVG